MVELPFLKVTYLYINIRKISAQRRFFLANIYEQQTIKHLLNSKSSWNQYIWVGTYLNKKNKLYTNLNNYHFSYLCLTIVLVQKNIKK